MPSGKPANDSAWPNLVGLAAYGLWGRMQTMMAAGQPYGHLTSLDGRPMPVSELARIVGETPRTVQPLLDRLVAARVLVFRDGLYSDPGMIHRKAISQIRSTAGRRGAEATNSRQGVQQDGQQPAGGLPQQKSPEPQQIAGHSAEGTPSRQVLDSGSSESLKPSTSTTSTAHAREADAEERVRRMQVVSGNPKVKAICALLPSPADGELLCAMLVQVSMKGGPDSVRGKAWLAEFQDMLSTERMHGQPVPPGVFAQAVRDYGGNGFLDDDADPKPVHFRAFVEYVRAGTPRPVHPSRVKKTGKDAAPIDTGGNDAAADRLKRQLGDNT